MNQYFHFFFYILLIIISSQLYICEILEIPLYNLKCAIQNKDSVKSLTLLDIKSNMTSLTEEFISSTDIKKEMDDDNKEYYEISSSNLLAGTNNSKLIPFTIISSIGHYPKLSLGRTYANENCSLVYYLYNNKIIQNKSFSLSISHLPEQKLYLGVIPNNMIKNKTQIKIPTSEKYKSWAFPIDSISIGNLTFAINKLGLLGLDSGSIIVNREIYLFLKDNIFKDFLEKHICYEEIWDKDSGANIYCSINDFPEFPLFYLNVNKGKDKIPIKISERDDREGFIDIAFNNELHNSDYIWVDKMFFYQYDVLFDYNDHTISVYVDKVVSKKCSIKKYFVLINIFILLISCIVIGYYKIII